MLTLLATLALGATQLGGLPEESASAQAFAALAVEQPVAVVVDCAVGADHLTDCKVIGEAGAAGPEAIQLAMQIPADTARQIAVDGRITIKLTVNP